MYLSRKRWDLTGYSRICVPFCSWECGEFVLHAFGRVEWAGSGRLDFDVSAHSVLVHTTSWIFGWIIVVEIFVSQNQAACLHTYRNMFDTPAWITQTGGSPTQETCFVVLSSLYLPPRGYFLLGSVQLFLPSWLCVLKTMRFSLNIASFFTPGKFDFTT